MTLHEGSIPDPEFVTLCNDAERRGLYVGLHVAGGKPSGLEGHEFRKWEMISVSPKDPKAGRMVSEYFRQGDTLRSVSARARYALGKV